MIEFDTSIPGWESFFQNEKTVQILRDISEKLEEDTICPHPDAIFRAFKETPLDTVKVVIMGQDPYPRVEDAMGMAFSVPNKRPIKQSPSLMNIYKELMDDIIDVHIDIKRDGTPRGNLRCWAIQGVFLINSALTTKVGAPNSHTTIWKKFTKHLMEWIARERNVVVILWGNKAQEYRGYFDERKHRIIKGVHPSPLSATKGFFGSRPFSRCNEYLQEMGHEPVDWSVRKISQ
jgi:uracil-DNA glycosylase